MKKLIRTVYPFFERVVETHTRPVLSLDQAADIVTLFRGGQTYQLVLHPKRFYVDIRVVNPDNTTSRLNHLVGVQSDDTASMVLDHAQQIMTAIEIHEEDL